MESARKNRTRTCNLLSRTVVALDRCLALEFGRHEQSSFTLRVMRCSRLLHTLALKTRGCTWPMGLTVNEVRIRRMKTRWGSCNAQAGRIWLNLELAKKSPVCLEYILVHEMVHLLERSHNQRFRSLMDSVMPNWRLFREELNRAPLAHEKWKY